MKLPRWLTLTLWSITAFALVVSELIGGSWWAHWPTRTARDFVDVMSRMQYEEVPKFFHRNCFDGPEWAHVVGSAKNVTDGKRVRYVLEAKPFSWGDYASGSRKFYVRELSESGLSEYHFVSISVARGTVRSAELSTTFSTSRQSSAVWVFLAEHAHSP